MIFSPIIKKLSPVFAFFRRIRFTQTIVLTGGMMVLILFFIAILAWDGYLFMQSLSPPQQKTIKEPKKISLTSQDIDDAIKILDQREQQFDTLIRTVTGTSTIVF